MTGYRLIDTEIVIRTSDGASIPNDPGNGDRAEYAAWLADGNVPDPYVAPPLPPPIIPYTTMRARLTTAERQAILTAARSSWQLADWLGLAQADGSVNLGSDETVTAKAALVTAGLLTQARADAIFTG